MKKFIANSETSKKILNIAQLSSSMPVNIMIIGEIGVGKTLLSQYILPNATIYDAKFLENSIVQNSINLEQYNELIILNIELVLNKKEFLKNLSGIKLVATSNMTLGDIDEQFAIKIDIPTLEERSEDLNELIEVYVDEAKNIYDSNIDIKNIDIDLSQNGISLKKSIYKSVLLKSLNDDDMKNTLEYFIEKKLEEGKDYRGLLEFFEVPLLNAAKTKFKSQLKMATKLNINRITLRKKLEQYFGN
ncbi:MAG: Fis family transcriptional regulator [Campylobacterota bacterium]|nr:Fis family transcriptional regulator [Campylobacterota bacterium]